MTRIVMITGASSGFGLAATRLFAARGWAVVATMRDPSKAAGLELGQGVYAVGLEVTDRQSIEAAVDQVLARFGGIDVVVNNAGFGLFGPFEATPPERIADQFAVNLFGVMDVTRAVLPHFRARRAGCIVNVGSGAGVFGLPMLSLYTASKFALSGFTESLSYELATLGIVVKLVEPGGVTSTGFGARSAVEAGGLTDIPDYAPALAAGAGVFDGLRQAAESNTAEQVAEVIFEAATDGTARLRYIATADIAPLVEARRTLGEEAYMDLMRRRFSL